MTFLIAYYDRLNISLAMPLIAAENGWTDSETASNGALLMGLFYAGYGIANIFLTPFAARIGPRKSLVVIVLLWSLFTGLGALASQIMMIFMASRVLLGLSEGVHPPMMNQLTNTWFAPDERSRANSTWVSGLFLSILTAPIVLVPLMEEHGWRTGFYVLAVGGMLISLPLVLRFVHDRPAMHPRVSAALAENIERRAGSIDVDDHPTWRLLLERPFQLIMLGGIVNNAVALGIAGWLPTYLASLEGVRYADLTFLAAVPYGASLLGLAMWAVVGDKTNRRALVAAAGYFGTGILATSAFMAGSAQIVWLTVTLLSLSVFCVSAYTASEFALVQRIVPRAHVANGVGLYNGLTTMIGGGLGPYVVGGIIDGGADTGDLITIFGLCAAITVLLTAFSRRVNY
ncbi:MAG: MFS transporter [Woeseiaceae bacterium]|nr:MFS transporter [Woeseiaceae bacterium]